MNNLSELIYNEEEKKNPFSQYWLFTIYEYNKKIENNKTKLRNLYNIVIDENSIVRYIIFQGEKCPITGRKHLQGYIELNERVRRKKLQEILKCDKCWCAPRKARTNEKIISYCCKPNEDYPETEPKNDCFDEEENIRYEKGNKNIKQGERTDIREVAKLIQEGKSIKEATYNNPEIVIKYANGLQYLASMYKKIDEELIEEVKKIEYYEWQQELHDMLEKEADDRTIIWIYEDKGKVGKSKFVEKYELEHENECYAIDEIGNIKDATDGLRNWMIGGKKPRTILIDLERTREENITIYTFIEKLKNRAITCTKYKGEKIRFKSPHVVIFSNWLPEIKIEIKGKKKDTLSKDRWKIYEIKEKKLKELKLEEVEKIKEGKKEEKNNEIMDIDNYLEEMSIPSKSIN